MNDEDVRVSLARLDGRLAAAERRAEGSVGMELYVSERNTTREDVAAVRREHYELERVLERRMNAYDNKLAEARKEDLRTRRWLITTLVAIAIGTATVLVGVFT